MDIGNIKTPFKQSDSLDNTDEVNPFVDTKKDNAGLPAESPPRFLVPLAGLFLALVLLSGTEITLNNIQVAWINNGPDWQHQISRWSNKFEDNLALTSSLVDQRVLDIESGYRKINHEVQQSVVNVSSGVLALMSTVTDQVVLFRSTMAEWREDFNQSVLSFGGRGVESIENGLIQVNRGTNLVGIQASSMSANVLSGVTDGVVWGWETLKLYLDIIFYNLSLFVDGVAQNWRDFIGGEDDLVDTSVGALSPAEEALLREEIKQEVLAELEKEIQALVQGQNITEPTLIQSQNGQGLVVVPDSGNLSQDEVKSRIRNMFSDDVTVSFDASGQSGVITPIFRQATGNDYIFVLTPVSGQ